MILVTLAAIVRDVGVAAVVGGLLMVAAVVRGAAAERAALVARIGALVWVAAASVFLIASYVDIAQVSVTAPDFGSQLWSFVADIDLGRAYGLNVLAAVVTSIIVTLVRTPSEAAWGLVPVAYGLGVQAMTGHAAGAEDHHLAVTSLYVHLASSAVWLGLLLVVFVSRKPLAGDAKAAVQRVSRMSLWAASAIVATGAANAWLRVGSVTDLATTTYGRMLALKLLLMSGVIALAAWHRRATMPRLTSADVRARFYRVLAWDVALLAAVAGIGGVLSRTAPTIPVVLVPDPTPAFVLTGYPLPPRPDALQWILQWRLEILSAMVILALVLVYLRWASRLRRRGDDWPWQRTAAFLVGMAGIAWITQGAPAVYGMVTFSGHMMEHMLLAMAVPLPIVYAAPVTLALRALPSRGDGTRGPREWMRTIVESRWMRFIAHPVVAAVNFAGSLVVFYYSPLFEFALRNHAGHLWMIVHFTLAGYLFANALVGIDPGPTRPAYPMRVLLLFATMAFHAFFGVALTSSEVLLAPRWYGLMGRDWGADAITDQQYGGSIAWGLGELPVLILAIGVLVAWRRADARTAKRKDREAERSGDADLGAYNAMLGGLAASEDERPPSR
ncbi:bifunctional copper resistance protein CopD/cytochrome c oxidase assembly protein [Demequina sp. TTPB684]|uniref:cytochrome c oxidase assembly protein n=1 Tax=unclassified Demequina TaxID=2620311 RepID=UPI001CF16746|nr:MULTISPECIES: cytochrome c oxidase assembly protein [unclassified Demequina]MCB2412215.1 bifunctional copper resistance protein CopD/cytochrome c oxidase assembly protein [Demequina sp. TTPB684]UPU88005.1 bifunctional copper resistance protein CopD/cytochrome c oxidase assembly protein [Demequina sp. TMPB413]